MVSITFCADNVENDTTKKINNMFRFMANVFYTIDFLLIHKKI